MQLEPTTLWVLQSRVMGWATEWGL